MNSLCTKGARNKLGKTEAGGGKAVSKCLGRQKGGWIQVWWQQVVSSRFIGDAFWSLNKGLQSIRNLSWVPSLVSQTPEKQKGRKILLLLRLPMIAYWQWSLDERQGLVQIHNHQRVARYVLNSLSAFESCLVLGPAPTFCVNLCFCLLFFITLVLCCANAKPELLLDCLIFFIAMWLQMPHFSYFSCHGSFSWIP